MWMDGELLQLLYKNEIKSRFWREFPAYKDIAYTSLGNVYCWWFVILVNFKVV